MSGTNDNNQNAGSETGYTTFVRLMVETVGCIHVCVLSAKKKKKKKKKGRDLQAVNKHMLLKEFNNPFS